MRHHRTHERLVGAIVLACAALATNVARAGLSYYVEPNGWPNAAHRDAAVAAIQSALNRYNAYGDFGNDSVYVYYNSGIPTAQAGYLSSIGFGGTYPNERVTMHELAHYLGSGTYGTPWTGARSTALVDQFDGLEATLNGDSQHFWPYGLNYDSEGSEINRQRQVALVYAQRIDMGIGNTANPWSATAVALNSSDGLGESGFNYASRWSDARFAHSGATYTTNNFLLRTPASGNSFTFVGDQLVANNTNGASGGVLYNGTGTSGVIAFKQLHLAGGYLRHGSGSGDVFRVAGQVKLTGSPVVDAANGPIVMDANVVGTGAFTKQGVYDLTLTGAGDYSGDTVISAGTLRLAALSPIANYTFDNVVGTTIENVGTGGSAMNGLKNGRVSVIPNGSNGNCLSFASGGAGVVTISNGVTNLGYNNTWTITADVKTSTLGATILSKTDGGWYGGNSQFYLGDGTNSGSGGLPSSVRAGDGYVQASVGTTNVADDVWHQVAYVNRAGTILIFVDGVLQAMSTVANAGFTHDETGSQIRLGATTSPGDGATPFVGLMDNVRIYDHALSRTQLNAIAQGGLAAGSLPMTNLSIASGATFDVNGLAQQVASLSGPSGAAVQLGAGQLVVNTAASSSYAGTFAGAGGSLVKTGVGTLTLSGSVNSTGPTRVQQGTLVVTGPASASIFRGVGTSTDIQGGSLVFDYPVGGSVTASVLAILDAGFDQAVSFSSGRLFSSTLGATKLLGWIDDPANHRLTVRATLAGDANLDLAVNFDDLLALAQNYGAASGNVWSQGDTNYDGAVNFDDLLVLAQHYGQSMIAGESNVSPSNFAADWALAQSLVPEPVATAMLALSLPMLRRRRQTP